MHCSSREPSETGPTRPDGRWRARCRNTSGRKHSRHFPRKIDATRWLDEVTASVLAGQYVDPNAGRVTFRDVAEQWRGADPNQRITTAKMEELLESS